MNALQFEVLDMYCTSVVLWVAPKSHFVLWRVSPVEGSVTLLCVPHSYEWLDMISPTPSLFARTVGQAVWTWEVALSSQSYKCVLELEHELKEVSPTCWNVGAILAPFQYENYDSHKTASSEIYITNMFYLDSKKKTSPSTEFKVEMFYFLYKSFVRQLGARLAILDCFENWVGLSMRWRNTRFLFLTCLS